MLISPREAWKKNFTVLFQLPGWALVAPTLLCTELPLLSGFRAIRNRLTLDVERKCKLVAHAYYMYVIISTWRSTYVLLHGAHCYGIRAFYTSAESEMLCSTKCYRSVSSNRKVRSTMTRNAEKLNKIEKVVRPWPDWPDRVLRPCCVYMSVLLLSNRRLFLKYSVQLKESNMKVCFVILRNHFL